MRSPSIIRPYIASDRQEGGFSSLSPLLPPRSKYFHNSNCHRASNSHKCISSYPFYQNTLSPSSLPLSSTCLPVSFWELSSKIHKPKEKKFGGGVRREIIHLRLSQHSPNQIKKYKLCFLSPSVVTAASSVRRECKREKRQKERGQAKQGWAGQGATGRRAVGFSFTHDQNNLPRFSSWGITSPLWNDPC